MLGSKILTVAQPNSTDLLKMLSAEKSIYHMEALACWSSSLAALVCFLLMGFLTPFLKTRVDKHTLKESDKYYYGRGDPPQGRVDDPDQRGNTRPSAGRAAAAPGGNAYDRGAGYGGSSGYGGAGGGGFNGRM